MSMEAVFRCDHCKTESVHGRFKGNAQYEPEFKCEKCAQRTPHVFVRYRTEGSK